jgi:hypothetical protein
MPSFKKYYGTIYKTFGYPLSDRTSLSASVLIAAEKGLGVQVPTALWDYYLVAGRERRFNTCQNRLLSPSDWAVDGHRLIFMEENQNVVCWGVSIRNPAADDPPVAQGCDDDESMRWRAEHRKCSVWLAVMLHFQAVSGGFRFCGWGSAPEQSNYRFERSGWTYHGEVNSLKAYSRPNQVVCLVPPPPVEIPFMRGWSIHAGGKTNSDLQAIEAELGVPLTRM